MNTNNSAKEAASILNLRRGLCSRLLLFFHALFSTESSVPISPFLHSPSENYSSREHGELSDMSWPRGVNPSGHRRALGLQRRLCWELPCSGGPCCLLSGCDLGVKRSLQFQKMPDLLKEAPEEEHVSLKRFATSEKVGVDAQRPSKNRIGARNRGKDSIAVSRTLINL